MCVFPFELAGFLDVFRLRSRILSLPRLDGVQVDFMALKKICNAFPGGHGFLEKSDGLLL